MSLRIGLPLAAIAIAAAAGSAQAVFVLENGGQVSLAAVLDSNDRSFQIGDKLFTIVTYTSAALPATTLTVTGFISFNPLDGIGFDLTGGMGDQPGDTDIADINLKYTVEVLPDAYDAGFRIKDVGLAFNGAASGDGSYSRVDESIFDFFGVPGLNLLDTRAVFANAGPPATAQLQDFADLPNPTVGYRKLEIIKDIQFQAVGANGTSSASFVRQSFSQIPTPGGSLLAGVAGLILVRRRR